MWVDKTKLEILNSKYFLICCCAYRCQSSMTTRNGQSSKLLPRNTQQSIHAVQSPVSFTMNFNFNLTDSRFTMLQILTWVSKSSIRSFSLKLCAYTNRVNFYLIYATINSISVDNQAVVANVQSDCRLTNDGDSFHDIAQLLAATAIWRKVAAHWIRMYFDLSIVALLLASAHHSCVKCTIHRWVLGKAKTKK